jgi:flagellar L-ring protein precursor FlgH
MKRCRLCTVLLTIAAAGAAAHGQTSSLGLDRASRPQLAEGVRTPEPPELSEPPSMTSPEARLSPAIAASLMAVSSPEPRAYAKHDLVTIIIRESVENDSTAKLETEKDAQVKGKIDAFPKLQLSDLLEFQLGQSEMTRGIPEVSINLSNKYEGEGENARSDSFTARVQAEIIDIKPNGNLVLEARRFIKTDNETLTMTLTGTCRSDDVLVDNTVLSTVVADLRLVKEHTGELRKATRKGLITRFFETLFNF